MAIKTDRVKITSKTGTFEGYLATPGQGPRPGVVVIQEIFGVNAHIRSVCDRLAEAGYAALAPDLYWHVQPGIELGYTPEDIEKGREVRAKLSVDDTVDDVRAAFDVLGARPETKGRKLGITGFCWGGFVTYLAACRLKPACSAAYYGGGIPGYIGEMGNISAPILFHFGEKDASIPLEQVEQVREGIRQHGLSQAQVHVYPDAQHGFNCDLRGSYHEASARLAWQRTLEAFRTHLE